MKKGKQIFLLIFVILFFLGVGAFAIFNGIKSHNEHYIRIEVNPKVEFLTNNMNIVTNVIPENDEAKELLLQENLVGIHIKDATKKFIDLCTKANYIDVTNTKTNAIRITVVSGLMQALEMDIYESINEYLLKNEILAVIVENDNDLNLIKLAKENNISNANKLTIINSVINKMPEYSFEKLNKLSESEILEILQNYANKFNFNPNDFTQEEISNKVKLIDYNRQNYENHISKITKSSQKEFSSTLSEHKKLNTNKFEQNFENSYEKWKAI